MWEKALCKTQDNAAEQRACAFITPSHQAWEPQAELEHARRQGSIPSHCLASPLPIQPPNPRQLRFLPSFHQHDSSTERQWGEEGRNLVSIFPYFEHQFQTSPEMEA